MVAIVVAGAWKADELPARHVAVAAIDRIGEEAFDRVGEDRLEEHLAAAVLELDLTILEAGENLILLNRRQRHETFAGERCLAVILERGERNAVTLLRRDWRLHP